MMNRGAIWTISFCLVLGACSQGNLSNREAGAVSGAVIGAGAGAAVGRQVGQTGAGAAIGVAAGGLAGAMIGEGYESYDAQVAQQEEIIRRQEADMERQRREIEDLKRQQFYNQSMQRFEEGEQAGQREN